MVRCVILIVGRPLKLTVQLRAQHMNVISLLSVSLSNVISLVSLFPNPPSIYTPLSLSVQLTLKRSGVREDTSRKVPRLDLDQTPQTQSAPWTADSPSSDPNSPPLLHPL